MTGRAIYRQTNSGWLFCAHGREVTAPAGGRDASVLFRQGHPLAGCPPFESGFTTPSPRSAPFDARNGATVPVNCHHLPVQILTSKVAGEDRISTAQATTNLKGRPQTFCQRKGCPASALSPSSPSEDSRAGVDSTQIRGQLCGVYPDISKVLSCLTAPTPSI